MWLYLEKRRLRREAKLAKLEKKFAQKCCPHDYQVVLEHREWIGSKYVPLVDVWCPVCEHMWEDVSAMSWERWQNKRHERMRYERRTTR